ncbi:PCSK1 [Mytilus edulis]|uniref:PCSK1 n=1 Tax=Mytilus edulis TaxID=6550 RepID=A0A8S3PSE8_MYTED|nr:PCSK1 [Mytilus edulis]
MPSSKKKRTFLQDGPFEVIKTAILLQCIFSSIGAHYAVSENHYVNQWAVEIQGGHEEAKRVAKEHGYDIVKELKPFDNHYLLTHRSVPSRSKRHAHHHTRKLVTDKRDPKASTDLNDNDDDPQPRYDPTNENKHGTRCAGEIAMVANNSMCGVGIAYNANIGERSKNTGVIKAVKLVLHGTKELPDHVHRAGGARIYDNNYNKVIDERERTGSVESILHEFRDMMHIKDTREVW